MEEAYYGTLLSIYRTLESKYAQLKKYMRLDETRYRSLLLNELRHFIQLSEFAVYYTTIFSTFVRQKGRKDYETIASTYYTSILKMQETAGKKELSLIRTGWARKGYGINFEIHKVPEGFSESRNLVVVSSNATAVIKEHNGDFICDHVHSVDELDAYYKSHENIGKHACPMCSE